MVEDFLNANGLVDGRIPVGKDCPFKNNCAVDAAGKYRRSLVMNKKFSCALARGFSIVKRDQLEEKK
jgi:hypothetical protein